MSKTRCYFLEATPLVSVGLRRYSGYSARGRECNASGFGYHNAVEIVERGNESQYPDAHGDLWTHADPRWPTHCQCGYKFLPNDKWQFNPNKLYRRTDTDTLVTMEDAPPGAMVNAEWLGHLDKYEPGPDGMILMVKLPDGTWWCVDGPSVWQGVIKENGWSRSGIVPNVTANPSIVTPTFHGWLSDGWIIPC